MQSATPLPPGFAPSSRQAPGTPRTGRQHTPRQPTPRQFTPRQPTPRSGEGAGQQIDQKKVQLVWTSLKDRIYQRSHNLRHTFRELDAKGTGVIPLAEFTEEMGRAYQLSPVEKQCLRLLLGEADFNRDGKLDFREFCEMLKSHDKTGVVGELTAQERKRFDRCVIDKKMQSTVMKDDSKPIRLIGALPTNELGSMNIDCPYGVLGDSERMDAVVSTFLNVKIDKLRETFRDFDVNQNGRVSHAEFRVGMQNLDPYIFDEEVASLIGLMDRKGKGYVVVEDFINTLGKEYLKKKAHRSQAQHDSPFEWSDKPTVSSSIHIGQRGRGPCKKDLYPQGHVSVMGTVMGSSQFGPGASPQRSPRALGPARSTRASELRAGEGKERVTDIYRREDGDFAARVNAGTSASIPRPPPILGATQKRGQTAPYAGSHNSTPLGGRGGRSPRLPKLK